MSYKQPYAENIEELRIAYANNKRLANEVATYSEGGCGGRKTEGLEILVTML